jgi:hypothetical protein
MQSEEQALRRKAERSAAAAGLARTVQHDINNLLTVIFANLEMLKRTAAEGPPQRQLGRVEEAARRFEGTSRAILSFIRRPAGEVAPIRLSEALAVLRPLLQMILSGPGALTITLAEADPPVLLERSALEEGLLALAARLGLGDLRGPALALTVAPEAEAGRLTIDLPTGLAAPALEALAATCRAAGGEAVAEGTALRLSLPRHIAPG